MLLGVVNLIALQPHLIYLYFTKEHPTSFRPLILVHIIGGYPAGCSVAIFTSRPMALFPGRHLRHVVYQNFKRYTM
jgi:hypothetical protein